MPLPQVLGEPDQHGADQERLDPECAQFPTSADSSNPRTCHCTLNSQKHQQFQRMHDR
jgi:hypothetical protein